jgi:hypothetical protein
MAHLASSSQHSSGSPPHASPPPPPGQPCCVAPRPRTPRVRPRPRRARQDGRQGDARDGSKAAKGSRGASTPTHPHTHTPHERSSHGWGALRRWGASFALPPHERLHRRAIAEAVLNVTHMLPPRHQPAIAGAIVAGRAAAHRAPRGDVRPRRSKRPKTGKRSLGARAKARPRVNVVGGSQMRPPQSS